jgi:hypothetical protein
MYTYVPFDDIDKRKWNTTILQSPNGNIYGYYWYLKAIWREWGAIVENDYESVLPIIPYKMNKHERELLPELGPYSVHSLTRTRVDAMFAAAEEHIRSTVYPINNRVSSELYTGLEDHSAQLAILYAIDEYPALRDRYSEAVNKSIDDFDQDTVKLVSNVKPEEIIKAAGFPDLKSNILLRLMYNAMHRGVGWSTGILDKKTGKYLTLSYYMASHNNIYEIFTIPTKDKASRYYAMDLNIRNTASKPMKIISNQEVQGLANMGFDLEERVAIKVGKAPMSGLKKWLGL